MLWLSYTTIGGGSEAGATVEAVSTYLTLGQTDTFYESLKLIEFEGGQTEVLANDIHHLLIFGRICSGVFIQVLVGITFKIFDNTAGDELKIALGGGEAYEGTAVDKRRTGNTDMYLFSAVVEENACIVAKLCAAHDTVIAEEHTLPFEHSLIGNQLHLSYQITKFLTGRSEASRPCWSIFGDGSLIGHLMTICITEGHAYAGIGNTTAAVNFRIILLTHHISGMETAFLHILSFISGSGEAVVHPKE